MIKIFSTGLPLFLLYLGSSSLAATAYLGTIFEDQILTADDSYNYHKANLLAASLLYFGGLCALTFMMPISPLVYLFTFSTGMYFSFVEEEALSKTFRTQRSYI
tara:strand:+ start:361 stop:672 length:312 start_codon:yes stop_codon:yes gene_type:complete